MSEGRGRSTAGALWAALRPRHWVKNLFVLAPLVFAERFADPVSLGRSAAAFVVFCALASAVYLVNDLADREADRHHPRKRNRPIASGELGVGAALSVSVLLAVGALASAFAFDPWFGVVAAVYLVVNLLYSFWLKRQVIVDVMVLGAGYWFRVWGGAIVIDVEISHWLILCTWLIALFLGFVKRRQEIAGQANHRQTRASLRGYSLPFLDQMISVVTAATVLAYALYAFSDDVADRLGTDFMWLTIPFVLFGVFRYLYLVHEQGEGENPTSLVFRDAPLLGAVLLWGATVVLLLLLSG